METKHQAGQELQHTMDNDSDNDNEHDQDNDNEGELNLAGFLFGNVDEHGRLENDFLDEEAKQHLSSLSRYIWFYRFIV